MANRIIEGFDWFPSGKSSAARIVLIASNQMPLEGDGLTTPDVVTGRFGFGKALEFNFVNTAVTSSRRQGYLLPIGANISEGFILAAVYRPADCDDQAWPALAIYDAINAAPQFSVCFEEFGIVRVKRGAPNGGTVIGVSAMNAFQEENWFHAEVKFKIADTGGTVEVRINTVPVVQIPSADTKNTALSTGDSLWFGYAIMTSNVTVHCRFDDIGLNDLSGSANNDWSGNLRVKTQFMIANGATNPFSIGGSAPAATNWQSVLNNSLDDTKYVFSSNIGDIDLYTPDPNLNAPFVRALQVRMGLRQDDATQRGAKAVIRIGGVNYENAATHFTNQTYTQYKAIWDLSPATGVTLTGAEVNGCQVGVKVQS